MTTSLSPTTRAFANSSAYDFLNDHPAFELVRNAFAGGDNFRKFAAALGFSVSQIDTFVDHGPFECSSQAFNKWLKADHSVLDFVQVLIQVKHKVLASALGKQMLALYEYQVANGAIFEVGSVAVQPDICLRRTVLNDSEVPKVSRRSPRSREGEPVVLVKLGIEAPVGSRS